MDLLGDVSANSFAVVLAHMASSDPLNPPGNIGMVAGFIFAAPGYAITAYCNFYQVNQNGQIVYGGTLQGIEGTTTDISLGVVVSQSIARATKLLWKAPTPIGKIGGIIGGTLWLATNPDLVKDVKTFAMDSMNDAINIVKEFTDIVESQVTDVYSTAKLTLTNTAGKTSLVCSAAPLLPAVTIQQDLIDAIVSIKQSPIPGNPFFVNPEVSITLPSHSFKAYIGTDGVEAFNLIPGGSTPEGGTIVKMLAGADEVGVNGGRNSIDGGDGFDRVSYANAAEAIAVDLSAGTVVTGDGSASTDAVINIEAVTGSSHADSFRGTPYAASVPASQRRVAFAGGGEGDEYEVYSADRTEYRIADSAGENSLVFDRKAVAGRAKPVTNREEGTTYTLKGNVLTKKDPVTGAVSAEGADLEIMPTSGDGSGKVTLEGFIDGQFGIELEEDPLGDAFNAASSLWYGTDFTPFPGGNMLVTYKESDGGGVKGRIVDAEGKQVADVPGVLFSSPYASPPWKGVALNDGNVMLVGGTESGTLEATVIAPDGSLVADKLPVPLMGRTTAKAVACRSDGKVAVRHSYYDSTLEDPSLRLLQYR